MFTDQTNEWPEIENFESGDDWLDAMLAWGERQPKPTPEPQPAAESGSVFIQFSDEIIRELDEIEEKERQAAAKTAVEPAVEPMKGRTNWNRLQKFHKAQLENPDEEMLKTAKNCQLNLENNFFQILEFLKMFYQHKNRFVTCIDNYLAKVTHRKLRTFQRILKWGEEMGWWKRHTSGGYRDKEGKWRKDRRIELIIRDECKDPFHERKKPEPKKRGFKVPFQEYLADKKKVPIRSFMAHLRHWGATNLAWIGVNIFPEIEKRPDILESILYDADDMKLEGRAKVGFVLKEIQHRVLKYYPPVTTAA